jgi:hypothetical protein
MEKDLKHIYHVDIGVYWHNSTSFGEYLFLQGVSWKEQKKAHMSGLHRDKGATHNFSRMWKVWEDSRNKQEAKQARKWGARPPPWVPTLVV